jgi:hypothetical protein
MMTKENVRALIAKIWEPAPLVAGEDAAAYELVRQAAIEEWNPERFREWMLVRSVVNAHWELHRYELFEAAIVNELVAEGIASEIAAKLPLHDFLEIAKIWGAPRRLPYDMSARLNNLGTNDELAANRQAERAWRQLAFMAVRGDHDAAMQIETKTGPGRIGFDAKWGYGAILPALLLLARLKSAAETSLARNLAELERLRKSTGRKLVQVEPDEKKEGRATAQSAADDEVSVRIPRETGKPEQGR